MLQEIFVSLEQARGDIMPVRKGETKLPLEGIRVVGINTVWAGPYATMLLADWGAEVILVESLQHFTFGDRSAGGANAMRPPAIFVKMPIGGYSAYLKRDYDETARPWNRWAFFNCHARNKLSMTVDLAKPKGVDLFKRLIKASDVFIENMSAGWAEKRGIGYETLEEVNPRLIMISMSGFGTTGPYRDYRAQGTHLEGFVGHTYIRGYTDEDFTCTVPSYHCNDSSGAMAAFLAVAALHYRNRTGKGQYFDMAQAETVMPQLGEAIMDYTMNRRIQERMGNRSIHGLAPYGCYRCKGEDRWVNISVTNDKQWRGLCRAMGNPVWTKDEKFSDSASRYRNQDELDKHIEKWTCELDHYEITHMLQKEGVPAGPVLDERDMYNDPHLKERGFFEKLTHEECGTHLHPGLSWKMSKTPNHLRLPPVRLGEHNEYVYKEIIKVTDEEYEELTREGHIGIDILPTT